MSTRRGAIAGALAGLAWRAVEPALRRVFGHPFSDARIVTAFLVPSGDPPAALDYVMQAVGGATFGAAFVALGGRTTKQALAAVLVENSVLWPTVGLLQRRHPDVVSGRWPPPAKNPRALAVSFSGHALYALFLGRLLRATER